MSLKLENGINLTPRQVAKTYVLRKMQALNEPEEIQEFVERHTFPTDRELEKIKEQIGKIIDRQIPKNSSLDDYFKKGSM